MLSLHVAPTRSRPCHSRTGFTQRPAARLTPPRDPSPRCTPWPWPAAQAWWLWKQGELVAQERQLVQHTGAQAVATLLAVSSAAQT